MNFTLVFTVQAESQHVLPYLADMQLFSQAHPLISTFETLGKRSFIVHEIVPLGKFKIPFTYPVIVKVQSKMLTVFFKSVILKLISVQMSFEIEEQHHRCRVHETVQIKSFLPVGFILKMLITENHKVLFRNIEKAIQVH